ncbi:reverse transcriptase domain-containing protein [Tanacetum coccineum]
MAERTMEELLRAPTEGYGEAIVLPEINAHHFEIKTNLITFRDVLNDVIKLMMFPYSLEGNARLCEAWKRFKEMLRACPHHGFTELTQVDTFYNGLNDNDQDSLNATAGGNLLSKTTREALNIIENKSKVRYSRNKSNASRMNTTSRESVSKTDERIDKLADQILTLVEIVSKKSSTDNNQASVCATTGSYIQVNPPNHVSNQMAPPGFALVQNNGQNRFNQNQGQGNNFNRGNNFHVPNNQVQQEFSNEFSSYKRNNDQMMKNMQTQINSLKGDLKNEIQNTIKSQQAVMMNQQTNFQNNLQNMICGLFQNQASTLGTLSSNTILNPKGEMKAITTQSGVAYEGPSIPTNPSPKKVVKRETKEITVKEKTNFQGSTAQIPPLVTSISIPKPDVLKSLPKPNIPYPSHHDDQKSREKALNQMKKIFQIFQDLRFDISFADALLLMPRFNPTIKSLLMNKEKLLELAKIPLNENCSAILLKKLPEKLGDPGKFLIPCNFPGMDVCHALADLGASINLMPLSFWKKLSLPELTPTHMTLELADRSITHPKGLAEDVYIKVVKFHFPTDFVVVDFEADPRIPLILGRSFLRTDRALIDVCGEEITLRVDNKAVTFNLDQTTRYSSTNDKSVNRIDIIDAVCEEYAPKLLGFSNSLGGNPTPTSEPFTFEFILEEIKAYLKDDSISPKIDYADCDLKEDICLFEKLLNNDLFQLPPMDLKQSEVTKAKYSIEEPPELELKDLPSHLEYAYLEENNKLPVIIAKGLKVVEKDALVKVLKSHKWAIAWKITDIKGINSRFCTHKILMEDDYKPTVQIQRRVNQKLYEVIKKEVLKLLDAGMIYLISDSLWVSPVHCVPKKGGIIVVANKENELIPTRIEADRAKIDVIAKLPHPTYRKVLEFSWSASKTMTEAQIHYTTTEKEMLAIVYAFEKFRPYLVLSKSIMYTDHSALKYLMNKQDAKPRTPRAIISDRGTHFCNDQFAKVMSKYRVTHRLATAYHPQTSGQVEVSNRGLKCILERTVGENCASWSDKLDDALWVFHTSFKTPIGCTPYKLVYMKSYHLPIELEHKAYWALKHANFNLKTVGDHRKLQLNELNELRDQTYENSLIYKERMKKLHDSKIKNRIFNVSDRVLLFNSHLKIFSGKLKTRWSGPFTITKVFPYGTIELSQPDGPNFKVNGHLVKHYFGGDLPPKVV